MSAQDWATDVRGRNNIEKDEYPAVSYVTGLLARLDQYLRVGDAASIFQGLEGSVTKPPNNEAIGRDSWVCCVYVASKSSWRFWARR